MNAESTGRIIGAAIEVHRCLGPGLLESSYQACLAHEMERRGIPFRREVSLPVAYKGLQLDCSYRLDFVVEEQIILELKSVEALHPIHTAQLLTYLKIASLPLGLLINFNTLVLRDGIKRLAL